MLNKKKNPNDPIKVFTKLGIHHKIDLMDMLKTEFDEQIDSEVEEFDDSRLGNTVDNLMSISFIKTRKQKKEE